MCPKSECRVCLPFCRPNILVIGVNDERRCPTVLFGAVIGMVNILCKQDEKFGLCAVGDPHFSPLRR